MAHFTELNDRNLTLHRTPARLCPSIGYKLWGLQPQCLHTESQPCIYYKASYSNGDPPLYSQQ
jgi:hypothetical protein